MNEKLQTLLTQLNSSQTVSLPEFVTAIEEEPNLDLTSIFTGTETPGSSINWKNTEDVADYMKTANYLMITGTEDWSFSVENYQINNVSVYLNVEETDNSESLISAVLIGHIILGQINQPVIILKSDDYLSIFLYNNPGTSVYLDKNIIGEFLNIPSLLSYYPDEMKYLPGLECSMIELVYSITSRSFICYYIESSAPDWKVGRNFILEFDQCKIKCRIEQPFTSNAASFIITANMLLNNNSINGVKVKLTPDESDRVCILLNEGNQPIPSLNDLSYLFYKSDINNLLPDKLSYIPNSILKNFCFIYNSDFNDMLYYQIGISTSDNFTWNIIPGMLALENIALDFKYSPFSCDVEGILNLASADLKLKTRIDNNSDENLNLAFSLSEEQNTGIDINISDLSVFGFTIFDKIPFIENLNFTLHDYFMSVNVIPSLKINQLSFSISSENSCQLLPSIILKNINLFLDIEYDNNYAISGSLSGIISKDEYQVSVGISMPSTGDWSLKLLEGSNQVGDDTGTVTIPDTQPSIPLPSISDICDLIGIGDFADKLPSGFLLDGIELADLLITFPKPTEEAAIHTAAFELKTTTEWEFLPGVFSMKDIKLKANIDFTGEETDYTFTLSGTVEIAGIDLNAMVSRNADNDWVYEIDLDIDPADKPSVKEMI